MTFLSQNLERYKFNSTIHGINTRNKLQLHEPSNTLTIYTKGAYNGSIKIFNKLPDYAADSVLRKKCHVSNLLALWGCAVSSNLAKIRRYQAKTLRQITNAPWYVTNHTLQKDLSIPQVQMVLQQQIATHRTALQSHPNPLMAHVLNQPDSRRLQRRWTLDENT